MKAQELRIGNYHLYHIVDKLDERGEYDEICKIDADDFGILENFDCPEYKPIPLTEEWLLKFGFEKMSSNYERGWLLLWGNLKTGTIDFVINEPHSSKRHITALKYVHQLQNLYFALTGEELKIKQK
jgi:hypothetical protein